MTGHSDGTKPSAKARALEELRKYAYLSAYLYICFGVLLLYKASILEAQNVHFLHFGIALAKALIIGKFILIGDAIKVGLRGPADVLLHRILWRSLALLIMLMIFSVLEEVIVGWFHGHSIAQSLVEYASRTWVELLAPELVMLLILIPLIAAVELQRAMGSGTLSDLMRGRESERDR